MDLDLVQLNGWLLSVGFPAILTITTCRPKLNTAGQIGDIAPSIDQLIPREDLHYYPVHQAVFLAGDLFEQDRFHLEVDLVYRVIIQGLADDLGGGR
jgi:hypothetical protein